MNSFLPEGMLLHTKNNQDALNPAGLASALSSGAILEAAVLLCDASHNLIVDLNGITGIIPRTEAAIGIREGKTKEIAILSRVGKPVCFKVIEITEDADGKVMAVLSRRQAQVEALDYLFSNRTPGDVITAAITHLEHFGAFADIGCGVASLMGIENMSVSRIDHGSDRFKTGDVIKAVILSMDAQERRISLTHKELLGTWDENANLFSVGETVSAVVRSIKEYGIFVELMPNLSGLAEYKENLKPGDLVSVFIKSIIPEKMKIKLIALDKLDKKLLSPKSIMYFNESEHIDRWVYSSEASTRPPIETSFH